MKINTISTYVLVCLLIFSKWNLIVLVRAAGEDGSVASSDSEDEECGKLSVLASGGSDNGDNEQGLKAFGLSGNGTKHSAGGRGGPEKDGSFPCDPNASMTTRLSPQKGMTAGFQPQESMPSDRSFDPEYQDQDGIYHTLPSGAPYGTDPSGHSMSYDSGAHGHTMPTPVHSIRTAEGGGPYSHGHSGHGMSHDSHYQTGASYDTGKEKTTKSSSNKKKSSCCGCFGK